MDSNRFLIAGLLSFVLITQLIPIKETNAVALSPLVFEFSANPGETISSVIQVTNTDNFPAGISIEVEDFVPAGEEGRVVLEDQAGNSTYSLAKWVTTSPRAFQLEANESRPVEFSINIPIGAEPGGHYSSILATISASPQSGGVAVAQKIGSLLLLNVAGDVTEKVSIAEFSVPNFSEYGPVNIVTRFENTGTVHLKPRGFIHIKNIFGKEIETLDLPQKNVLPRSIRRVEVPWGERIMFGKYEATITAVYGSTNEPLSAVTTFWVIPWKIAGAIAIGILILLIILIKGRKRIRLALSVIFKGAPKHPNLHA